MLYIGSKLPDYELPLISYIPANKDESLSAEKKQAEINCILEVLRKYSEYLGPKHLPELYFLRERVQRLSQDSSVLIENIEKIIAGIAKPEEGTAERSEADLCLLALKIDRLKFHEGEREDLRSTFAKDVKKYIGQKADGDVQAFISERLSHSNSTDFRYCNFFGALRITRLIFDVEMDAYQRFLADLDSHGIDVQKLSLEKQGDVPLPLLIRHIFELLADIPEGEAGSVDQEILREKAFNKLYFDLIKTGIQRYQLTNDANEEITVTPLIIAVFLNIPELLEILLKKGYRVNESDNQGYTAAHFAAMMNDLPMLFVLKKYGADFTLKNRLGATVYDLLCARGFAKVDKNTQILTYRGQNCTLEEYEQRFNRKYMPESIFSFEALLAIWWYNKHPKDFEHPEEHRKSVQECYLKIKQDGGFYHPPVYLNKIENGEDGQPSPLAGDLEVRASRTIEAGEFIFEYTGEVLYNPKQEGRSYFVPMLPFFPIVVDGAKGGAFAELINHGPENCLQMMVLYKGTPRILFYAIRRIDKDEPLFFNYSPYYFYNTLFPTPFHELSPKSIDKFIAQTKGLTEFFPYLVMNKQGKTLEYNFYYSKLFWTHKVEELKSPGIIKEKELQAANNQQMIRYILSFPERVLQLIENGKLDAESVLNVLDLRKRVPSFLKHCNLTEESMASLIQRIKEAQKKVQAKAKA